MIVFRCKKCILGPCVILQGAHNSDESFLMPDKCLFNNPDVEWHCVREPVKIREYLNSMFNLEVKLPESLEEMKEWIKSCG